MARHVAILHGWSDTSESFRPLATFLAKNGYEPVNLWLGDYISMDDDVKIEDVANRMEAVVAQKLKDNELAAHFDMIVHSTGGLVARQWITEYYASQGRGCPVERLVMLAPANFGSRLAVLGKSMLGRIFKGATNFFHTGTEMLNALELASPFQWRLAQRDLFVPEGQANSLAVYGYGDRLVAPFVIIGSHPYAGLRALVNEKGGADGTVRVAAASLNVNGMTVDFASKPALETPEIRTWQRRHGDMEIPLAVLPDRDHASIINPSAMGLKVASDEIKNRLGRLILQALACDTRDRYAAMAVEWDKISEDTASLADDKNRRDQLFIDGSQVNSEFFHQYYQVNVRVEDNHGNPVPDFFLEFFGPEANWGSEAFYFHKEVLERVDNNKLGAENRCFYIDRNDLVLNFYKMIPEGIEKILRATITAAPPGPNVSYFSTENHQAKGRIEVHGIKDDYRWLRRNSTHFVRIIIPRIPRDQVFRLQRFT